MGEREEYFLSNLLDQYKNQWRFRDWESLFSKLPDLSNSFVYDLGCAHGDHSQKLSEMGANVVGLDGNKDLLDFAIKRNILNAEFRLCDLSNLDSLNLAKADGIWSSFVPAYFTNFDKTLNSWKKLLKPNGWMALTEMSGLFDHLPMSKESQTLIKDFYLNSLSRENYDFESGEKLKSCLERNGFKIKESFFLKDDELSFQGPAKDVVIKAWESRLQRMGGLKNFFGDKFDEFRDDFLLAIQNENHVSNCKVYFYLATIE